MPTFSQAMARAWPRLGQFLLTTLLVGGCSTGWHKPRAGSGDVASGSGSHARQQIPDRELERRAEAYAQFATAISRDLRNEPRLAEAAMESSLKADPGNEILSIELAQRYLRLREPAKAVTVLTAASRQPGAGAPVFGWLGAAELQLTNQPAAMAAYQEAIRRAPQSILGYHGLAQIHLHAGRTNAALGVLDEGASRSDATPALLVDLAGFYIAAARQRLLPTDITQPRALALLEKASRLKPTAPAVLERLADGYKAVGEAKRALAYYEELLRTHPPEDPADRLALRDELFRLYTRENEMAKAGEQLERILEDQPANPKVRLLLGAVSMDQRKYDEACRHLEQAILLDPNLEPAYYDLAGAHLALRQPEEALEVLGAARGRFRAGFLVEFYTGLALASQEKYAQALDHIGNAELHARVSEPDRLTDAFYFQLGSVNERAGRIAEAEAAFRKCLELDPKNAEALNYLGYMWAERGVNLDEARAFIERALSIEPDSPAFLDSLAWVLFKQGKAAAALDHQLRALSLMPQPDATLLDHLGDIRAALGQVDQARDAWKKSLEVEPNPVVEKKLHAQPAEPGNP